MQQNRRQEEDGRIEVEDRRDERNEPERGEKETVRPGRKPCDPGAGSSEQAVCLGNDAHEQKPRHEDECRPDLPGGG